MFRSIYNCSECEIKTNDNRVTCNKCENGLFLKDNSCSNTCEGGYFVLDSINLKCELCSNYEGNLGNCKECLSETECTECNGNEFLQNGKCVVNCDRYHYINGTKCSYCNESLSNCLECLSSTKYLACINETKLLNDTSISNCPNGYYEISASTGKKCEKCSKGCAKCENDNCITCNEEYYEYTNQDGKVRCGMCSSAQENCVTCESKVNCTKCINEYWLENGLCKQSCEEGYYNGQSEENGENQKCYSCSTTLGEHCIECKSSELCTKCSPEKYLINGECDDHCPNETYVTKNNVCKLCRSSIIYCVQCLNSSFCVECIEGYYSFNGECVKYCPANTVATKGDNKCVHDYYIITVYHEYLNINDVGHETNVPLKDNVDDLTWISSDRKYVIMRGRDTPKSNWYFESLTSNANIKIEPEGDPTYHNAIFGIKASENTPIINVETNFVPLYLYSDDSSGKDADNQVTISTSFSMLDLEFDRTTNINSKLIITVPTLSKIVRINEIFAVRGESTLLTTSKGIENIATTAGKIVVEDGSKLNIPIMAADQKIEIGKGGLIYISKETNSNPETTDISLHYDPNSEERKVVFDTDKWADFTKAIPDSIHLINDSPLTNKTMKTQPDWPIVCAKQFFNCRKDWPSFLDPSSPKFAKSSTYPYNYGFCQRTEDFRTCFIVTIKSEDELISESINSKNDNDSGEGDQKKSGVNSSMWLIIGSVAGFLVIASTCYIVWRYIVIWKNRERSTSTSLDNFEAPRETNINDADCEPNSHDIESSVDIV